MWVKPQYARAIKDSILSLTTRGRQEQQIGLGQCIKEVVMNKATLFNFCSLISWSPTDHLTDLVLLPDLTKLFTQKQYYSKRNAEIHADPSLYVAGKLI